MPSSQSEPARADLWAEYKADGGKELRDQLIEIYLPIVRLVAARLATRLRHNVEIAELVGYGTFGLIDAIDKFEPERGFKFETYAAPRIKGAILDEIRSFDWAPRSVRARGRDIGETAVALQTALGRRPTDGEVAEALGIGEDEYRSRVGRMSFARLERLDEPDYLGGHTDAPAVLTTRGERLPDSRIDGAGSHSLDEIRAVLAETITELSERERIVFVLYYFEGLTQAGVGEELGITESRVQQILTDILMRFRGRLGLASS